MDTSPYSGCFNINVSCFTKFDDTIDQCVSDICTIPKSNLLGPSGDCCHDPKERKPREISAKEAETLQKANEWNQHNRVWEWPIALETDYCSIPSDCEIGSGDVPKRLSVPLPREGTFASLEPSRTFRADPLGLAFHQDSSNGDWERTKYFIVQNCGTKSRRISLVPPENPKWTVTRVNLKNTSVVPPGLEVRFRVDFQSPRPNEPLSMESKIIIKVEEDGGILIPIKATPQEPPILEIEDFQCGCSFVRHSVIRSFSVINKGGCGRFWILSEAEFMTERFSDEPRKDQSKVAEISSVADELQQIEEACIQEDAGEDGNNVPPNTPRSFHQAQEAFQAVDAEREVEGERSLSDWTIFGEDETEMMPPPNSPAETKWEPNKLNVPPFYMKSTCFELKGGQEIRLYVKFEPLAAGHFSEKVALLCDNGEVRWFVISGLGIEPGTQKAIKLHFGCFGLLSSPKCAFNFGPGNPEEPFHVEIMIENECILPIYFNWIVEDGLDQEAQTALENDCKSEDFDGEDAETMLSKPTHTVQIPGLEELSILPIYEIVPPRENCNCSLKFKCPKQFGKFGSKVRLRIQQLDQKLLKHIQLVYLQESTIDEMSESEKSRHLLVLPYLKMPQLNLDKLPPGEELYALDLLLESQPLQCFFEPCPLVGIGFPTTQRDRKLKFRNETMYEISLNVISYQDGTVSIRVSPGIVKVKAKETVCLKVTFRFHREATMELELKGFLQLPYKTVNVRVPVKISCQNPEEVLGTTNTDQIQVDQEVEDVQAKDEETLDEETDETEYAQSTELLLADEEEID